MLKTALAALSVATLLAGCVSVGSSTPEPTASPTSALPSLGITTPAPATPTPSVAPTASPTPTEAATPAPTEEPTASTGPTVTPAPSSGAPVSDLLFDDLMNDPQSGWDQLTLDFASIGVSAGALRIQIDQAGAWAYTIRELAAPQAVLRPVAIFTPNDDSAFGLLCGNTDGILFGSVINTAGVLTFFKVTPTADQGPLITKLGDEFDLSLDVDVPLNASSTFGIQCTGSDNGLVRIEALLKGAGPVAIYQSDVADPDVPASFSVMGIYGEARNDNLEIDVDEAAAFGLDALTTPSADAQALLTHVPAAWQSTCAQNPVPPLFGESANVALICVLQTSGPGAELAEYVTFANVDDMQAAYQSRIDEFGVESTGLCGSGNPNETNWTINENGTDVEHGRVQCAPQSVGIRYDWTDDRLNILASLVDFDAAGDYAAAFDDWAHGGPNL